MHGSPTVEDLRHLSARSRRAQAWGFVAITGALACVPAMMVARMWLGETMATLAALGVAGALFLRYAYAMGQERGAFRRVFRRLNEERRSRVLVPEGPSPAETPTMRR